MGNFDYDFRILTLLRFTATAKLITFKLICFRLTIVTEAFLARMTLPWTANIFWTWSVGVT